MAASLAAPNPCRAHLRLIKISARARQKRYGLPKGEGPGGLRLGKIRANTSVTAEVVHFGLLGSVAMKYAIAAAALALALLPASPVLAQAVDVPTAATTQVSPLVVNGNTS